jgi:hypothetical protein
MEKAITKAGKKPAKQPEFLSICPEHYERIEHYSNRSTIWIKLYADLLRDFDFCKLPDETKWHFIGLMILATQMFNHLRNDVDFLMQQIGANKKINVELLLQSGFLIPAKRMNAKRKSASTNSDSADKEKEKEEDKEKEKEKEKKKEKEEDDDAVASSRGQDKEKDGRKRADRNGINPSDFYDKLLNYKTKDGFKGDVYKLRNEIHLGIYDSDIINLVQSNKL